MNEVEKITNSNAVAKLPLLAAVVALIGLGDAIYLTIHHLTGEMVPCSVTGGCETVLTSSYAEIGGIPLAAFGAIAYFIAFSLAILAAFGNRKAWFVFGIQVSLMAATSLYLIYLQLFVIKAICQYCMLSAGVCLTLFVIALITKFWKTN
jgi:uncharacterized membrane protein